ncbi:MAG: DUF4893 domain-containing protein [Pseudomonadota bacterium]
MRGRPADGLPQLDSEKRLIFLGAGHYAGEKPLAYAAEAERDLIGYVTRPAPARLRIEFPSPRFESVHDILDLGR